MNKKTTILSDADKEELLGFVRDIALRTDPVGDETIYEFHQLSLTHIADLAITLREKPDHIPSDEDLMLVKDDLAAYIKENKSTKKAKKAAAAASVLQEEFLDELTRNLPDHPPTPPASPGKIVTKLRLDAPKFAILATPYPQSYLE